jgi:hypothetical protein
VLALVLSALLLAASPGPELTVYLQAGSTFVATWLGPAETSGNEEFEGTLACFGSPAAMPVATRAERDGALLKISARLRYADVPAEWARQWAPGAGCLLRGRLTGGGVIDWSSPMACDLSPPAGESEGGLISLTSLELIRLSDTVAEVRAVLTAVNPFSFPLDVAAATGSVRVRGEEIGSAPAKGRALLPRKKARFKIELRADPQHFRAAAGDRWAVGGELESEVETALTLRLSGGEQTLRIRLPGKMGTDGARSGVYSFPPAASSLSPR